MIRLEPVGYCGPVGKTFLFSGSHKPSRDRTCHLKSVEAAWPPSARRLRKPHFHQAADLLPSAWLHGVGTLVRCDSCSFSSVNGKHNPSDEPSFVR
jgi:hypothetical protein